MSQACARTEALLTVEGIVDSSSFTIQHGRVIDPNIASRLAAQIEIEIQVA
jgi:hypothetical protein